MGLMLSLLPIVVILHTQTPDKLPGKDVTYWFSGQKIEGQGHNVLITENGKVR